MRSIWRSKILLQVRRVVNIFSSNQKKKNLMLPHILYSNYYYFCLFGQVRRPTLSARHVFAQLATLNSSSRSPRCSPQSRARPAATLHRRRPRAAGVRAERRGGEAGRSLLDSAPASAPVGQTSTAPGSATPAPEGTPAATPSSPAPAEKQAPSSGGILDKLQPKAPQ